MGTATNLLSLPQIAAGTSITIQSDADWTDQFYVGVPGFPTVPLIVTGTLGASSTTVSSLSSVNGVIPGMMVAAYGVPNGTTVVSVGTTSLVLSNGATVAIAGASLTLYPPPLDLSLITFKSVLRTVVTQPLVLKQMSTDNGLMINGRGTGAFGWNVPAATLPSWPDSLAQTGSLACVLDISATDSSGAVVNLCTQSGPIPVTVRLSVTR